MPKTTIHVNPHVLNANAVTGRNDPAIVVIYESGETILAHEVEIVGPCGQTCRFLQRDHEPLATGAKVWAETTQAVHVTVANTEG